MKRIGKVIWWYISRIYNFAGSIPAYFIRTFLPIRKGTVACWAWDFKQYSCNPRYLTEHLLEHAPQFDIYWIFRGSSCPETDSRIKCVKYRSWEYLKLMNTAEFLVTNTRTDFLRRHCIKRPGQKYLMLWHGGVALKKIEKDVEDRLSYTYIQKAKGDSANCDLMVSGCRFHTELIRSSFWYEGEILEKGLPRSDIFFDRDRHAEIREKIFSTFGIDKESRLVLYAPTFRNGKDTKPYNIDWNQTQAELAGHFGSKVTVLIRLHPHLIGKVDISSFTDSPDVKDATRYHDMQELLCASDMLITDYSSTMFDFMLLRRPCLLYATDIEQYDRGYYFDFKTLPFPLARTQEELIRNIREFDMTSYLASTDRFDKEEIGLEEKGDACHELALWMERHSIQRTSL